MGLLLIIVKTIFQRQQVQLVYYLYFILKNDLSCLWFGFVCVCF